MGSLLDLNLANTPRLTPVPEGEYLLEVVSSELRTAQSGKNMWMVRFAIPEIETASDIFHNFMLPDKEDDAKTVIAKKNRIQDFCEAFGVDQTQAIDTEGIAGLRGYAVLRLRQDPEFGDRNEVKSWTKGH